MKTRTVSQSSSIVSFSLCLFALRYVLTDSRLALRYVLPLFEGALVFSSRIGVLVHRSFSRRQTEK